MKWASKVKQWLTPQNSTTSSPGQWLVDWMRGGQSSASGVSINVGNSLNISAVWACVRLRSDSLATLPLKLYRRTEEGKQEEATGLSRLLHRKPNHRMNAREFKFFMQASLDLWGNAYAVKEVQGGIVTALIPVTPSKVIVNEDDAGRVYYHITSSPGETETFRASEILHLRQMNLADDGLTGLSTIGYHRETLGGAVARRDHGNRFFGNGSIPGGVITSPGRMQSEQKTELRHSWQKLHARDNQHKVAVLDQGLDYKQISIPNEDSQWLESMGYDTADIARIFGVPSPLINDHAKSSFNNVEQLSLNWRIYGIRPMASLWEAALNDQCLQTAQQRNSMFWEFVIEDLLTADLESKAAYLERMFFNGFMNRNEVRSKLNLNPVPGGNTFYLQSAMAPLGDDGSLIAPDPAEPQEPPEGSADAENMVRDMGAKLAVIARDRILRAAGRDGNFIEWLEDFNGKHLSHCTEKLSAPLRLMGATNPEEIVREWVQGLHDSIWEATASATKETLKAHLDELLTNKETQRAESLLQILRSQVDAKANQLQPV